MKKFIAPDILYSTKVWLTSVLVSPFFIVIATRGFEGNLFDAREFIFLALVFGFLFSIPCWIVLMIVVRLTYNSDFEEKKSKTIINVVSAGIALLAFFITRELIASFLWVLPYLITLTFGIWYYKLTRIVPVLTIEDHLVE